MTLYLDDTQCRSSLLPFSKTRHVADFRIGITTIREKWERLSGIEVVTHHREGAITVPAHYVPSKNNYQHILEACSQGFDYLGPELLTIEHPWHIFEKNEQAIKNDFEWLRENRGSEFDPTNQFINRDDIFIEPGARVSHSILNASTGPIYIEKDCLVMEGCLIRGPLAMLKGSVLKMGARVYGATTLGPGSVAAGEIKNAVFFGNSNKAHDGYLGDSVIGEWCNLGAGTSVSNIKNNASSAKYTLSPAADPIYAGVKAGLLMGDYSRSAINTAFSTGSVVGVCCNIFGFSTPPVCLPDFSWGVEKYILEKAYSDINNWKKLKGSFITDREKSILQSLYQKLLT